ncbi:MAG: helix-turn-helix transcriptional regulator, partial [Bacteroidales bacterium]|nr:helix-turn-helix transcriptional regulator [Bacteroidales bacterium]
MTGAEICEVLSKCLDLYRAGDVYMEPRLAAKYAEAVAELTKKIEDRESISGALRYVLVDVLAVSLSDVGIDIGLDGNTISKYVTGARNPSVGVVIAVCLDVHLPPQVTHALLKKTHYNFLAGNKRDVAYLVV